MQPDDELEKVRAELLEADEEIKRLNAVARDNETRVAVLQRMVRIIELQRDELIIKLAQKE